MIPAFNAPNKSFKLSRITGNSFTFGKIPTTITIKGNIMIFDNFEGGNPLRTPFEGKPSYYLTDNIMKFLSSNQSTLKKFTPEEKIDLLEILTITDSLTSSDNRSPRGKALKELKAEGHELYAAADAAAAASLEYSETKSPYGDTPEGLGTP